MRVSSPQLDVDALAAALNDEVPWAELGFVCDGRFLFFAAQPGARTATRFLYPIPHRAARKATALWVVT